MTATTFNFSLSKNLAANFSLAAKKEKYPPALRPMLRPSQVLSSESLILRASENILSSFLQTLGIILLFALLLQPLASWIPRLASQNQTREESLPFPTSHLKKTTYHYDAVSGSSLYCNGDPVNGLDPDGRCVEGTKAGWANGNGSFAGTYDSSQANSQLAYGLGWTVGGALGTINGIAASLTTRPLAAMGQGFNEVTDFAEENLNLAPGSLTAATFMFAPLAVAGEVAGGIEEAGVVSKTKPLLRQAYETDVQGLKGVSLSARAAGQDAEATARMIYGERNILKEQYLELTPIDKLKDIEIRNIQRYKNPFGPTIDDLRAKGKTWEQIIESASRPGGKDLNF